MSEGKVLVTGAAGFVGSHLVRRLLERGQRVVCLVRPGESLHRLDGLSVERVEGDLTRPDGLDACLEGVDTVYHLAAVLGGVPEEYFHRINCGGTRTLVERILRKGRPLQRFLFVSSIAAVGPSGRGRTNSEQTPCQPVSAYGASKMAAEQYLLGLEELPVTVVRLPLVYGPGSDGGLFVFFKMLNRRLKLKFGEGETNVAYVGDVAEGLIRAAQSPRTVGKTYILGEENPYRSSEIMRAITGVLGKRAVPIPMPYGLLYGVALLLEGVARVQRTVPVLTRDELRGYLGHRYWRFDTSRAVRDFGYVSQTPLREGVARTADWYRSQRWI